MTRLSVVDSTIKLQSNLCGPRGNRTLLTANLQGTPVTPLLKPMRFCRPPRYWPVFCRVRAYCITLMLAICARGDHRNRLSLGISQHRHPSGSHACVTRTLFVLIHVEVFVAALVYGPSAWQHSLLFSLPLSWHDQPLPPLSFVLGV